MVNRPDNCLYDSREYRMAICAQKTQTIDLRHASPLHHPRFALASCRGRARHCSVHSQRRLAQLELEVASIRPLSAEDVAQQLQAYLSAGATPAKVTDVRYSPKEDAYRVQFSWLDPKLGQTWFSELQLVSDGYGKYNGAIGSSDFLKAFGYTGPEMYVTAAKPSPFKQ